MTLRWWLPLGLTLLTGAVLAAQGIAFVQKDYREGLSGIDLALADEADALRRRIETALGDAEFTIESTLAEGVRWIDADRAPDPARVLAFFGPGQPWSYAPPRDDDNIALSEVEARLFGLSLRGGETFELRQRDPARALDAYAFYLPRIEDQARRSQLRLGMARSALASGRVELARALLESLLEVGAGTTGEGWPIDLVAGELWIRNGAPEIARARFLEKLRQGTRQISTALLAHWLALAGEDRGLEETLLERRALEGAVQGRSEELRQRSALLVGDRLVLRSEVGPGSVFVVAGARAALPRLEGGDVEVDLLEPGHAEPSGAVVRSVRLPGRNVLLTQVAATDPLRDEKIAALESRRFSQLLLLGILGVVLAGATLALVGAMSRQRRLAQVRARLVANVSHELKTPITSIRIFADMLADDELDESRTRRFGRLMRSESLRLSQLVENLLDFARSDDPGAPLPAQDLDAVGLLRRLAESFSYRARQERVDFELDLPEGAAEGSAFIHSNPQAIERITLNLLDNAVKYRREDEPRIRLGLREAENAIEIDVEDNGVGIDRGDRERIFEEFYRARFEDYGVQGSGLGLAISRRLARRLGGDLSVRSQPGLGSTFTLVLPRTAVGEEEA